MILGAALHALSPGPNGIDRERDALSRERTLLDRELYASDRELPLFDRELDAAFHGLASTPAHKTSHLVRFHPAY